MNLYHSFRHTVGGKVGHGFDIERTNELQFMSINAGARIYRRLQSIPEFIQTIRTMEEVGAYNKQYCSDKP